jgi:tRNA pseudouridine65 synthase
VHRLDGGTSGCLLFAFDGPTTGMLQAAMQHADARKTYYAFARGDAGWIDQHLEERQIKDDNGVPREASTVLHCVGACGESEERSSLVVATPSTGRYAPSFTLDPPPPLVSDLALVLALALVLVLALTLALTLAFALAFARWHQIRKHLNGLSHPVIGDSRHGDTKINRYWRQRGLERLGLHCASMALPLPDGSLLQVECPPPRELTDVWRELPWWEDACAALPLLSHS